MRASLASPRQVRATGAGSALGGFSALAIQGLWIRADRALQAHREDEALLYLRAINDLAPHVVSAARYTAFEIGANLAEGRADFAVRWRLIREGLRTLDTAVAENPRSPDARANRALFLVIRVLRTPDTAAAYRRDVDAHGAERAARQDLEEAVRLDPEDPLHRSNLAPMFQVEAERDAQDGRLADAAAHFTAAADAYEELAALLERDDAAYFAQEIAEARMLRDKNFTYAAAARDRVAPPR
jgi:hypothetical protein